ncbi:hypothetical protein [Aurantiacibacter gilvus]|uniref:Uncharacterized protein n=1 Tax=Aurantiacibacter gilvus TaxID=3139141 RepID=A0ABU9IC44_9SPHN
MRVLQVVRRGLLRSQLQASADNDGVFVAVQGPSIQWAILGGSLAQQRGLEFREMRVSRDQPVYLVCRGSNWQIGDEIPTDQIVYRYEP